MGYGQSDNDERTDISSDTPQDKALKDRMRGAAWGNFVCACWNGYLGFSLLQGRGEGLGKLLLGFVVLQILAGVWMILRPARWLLVVDAGIYFSCALWNGVAAELSGSFLIKMLAIVQVGFGIDALRRWKLHRSAVRRGDAPPVVVADAAATGRREASTEASVPVQGARTAGSWRGGVFVLTEDEMGSVRSEPESYDNVLVGEQQRVMGLPMKWYLVLAEGSGIAMDADGDCVSRITPEGLDTCPEGLAVRLEGGAKATFLLQEKGVFAAWAWKCNNEIEFSRGSGRGLRPTRWDLLCWWLTHDRRRSSWLRWPPSFGSRDDGLKAMCRDTELLDRQIKIWGIAAAEKWIAHADPQDAETLRSSITVRGKRGTRVALKSALGLFAATIVLAALGLYAPRKVSLANSPFGCITLMISVVTAIGGLVALGLGLRQKHLAGRVVNAGESGQMPTSEQSPQRDEDHVSAAAAPPPASLAARPDPPATAPPKEEPIRVTCVCGKKYKVARRHAGKKTRCKACGEMITIPTA